MNKAYSRINFQNAPSTATPLNATNLNKMDKAINDLDDRIIELSGYQEEAEESAEMASASASAAAKAAETATADAEARVNEVIQGLEVYTKADSHKKFASVIKQVATGSPILIKDGAGVEALDFKGKGRSTQNGTPTPDSPIAIKSVADSGYFDGELLQGYYNESGTFSSNTSYVCSKNLIPCNSGDNVKLAYAGKKGSITFNFYDKDMNVLSRPSNSSEVTEYEATAPTNVKYVHFMFREVSGTITPQTAKHITVTINGKYALIVKSVGAYEGELAQGYYSVSNNGQFVSSNGAKSNLNPILCNSGDMVTVKANCENVSSIRVLFFTDSGSFISGGNNDNTNEITLIAPTNASYYHFSILTTNAIEYIFVGLNAIKYIPLNEPLRSLGNVKDEVNLDEGNITRRFKEVIFDGSDELWLDNGQQASGLYRYNIRVADLKKQRMGAICTHFTPSNAYQFSEIKEVCFSTHPTSPELAFFTEYATLTVFKTWLQANPITVQYELAEPITETIEPVDIVTYDNVTYLTASDNAEMEVTYATDTKSYIDSKFAELHAALVNML